MLFRFFAHYVPTIPVFEVTTPDEIYAQSQFLFWAIVFVGGRKYSKDPTLVSTLVPHMNQLALLALNSTATPIETLKGLFLLCLWPTPVNSMHKDKSTILSGAAVQLAMQIGLHVIGNGQDFARIRLQSSRLQAVYRAKLWNYTMMIYHHTSLQEGITPLILVDSDNFVSSNDELIAEFPPELQIQRKMHDIIMTATAALTQALKSSVTLLNPLIDLYDNHLIELESQCSDPTSMSLSFC